ncbi:MAG: hypothetical protein ABL974_17315 [Prosthecobacter sp.]
MISQPTNSSCGLHYVATGERHLAEAVESRESARAVMPNVPAVIFTDLIDHPLVKHFEFVEPVKVAQRSFHDVVEPMLRSPFEKTLHLDTDTYIATDCSDVFEALDLFEVAVVHDPWRVDLKVETLPQSLPTINGGVIAFRKTPAVQELLASWPKIHQNKFAIHTRQNQPSLREAVYRSQARVLILPPEYNLRVWHPVAVGGFAKVRILHDRRPDLKELAVKLNAGYKPRLFGRIDWKLACYYYRTKFILVLTRLLKKITH